MGTFKEFCEKITLQCFRRPLWVLICLHLVEKVRRYITTLLEVTSGFMLFFSIVILRKIQVGNTTERNTLEVAHNNRMTSSLVTQFFLDELDEDFFGANNTITTDRSDLSEVIQLLSRTGENLVENPGFLPNFLIICTLLAPLPFFIFRSSSLVSEKKTGLRELMKFVGVSPTVWRTSHFINDTITATLYALLITLLLTWTSNPVLPHSNSFIIAVTIILHFQVITCLAFITSALSQDYEHSDGLAIIIYLGTYLVDKFWYNRYYLLPAYALAWILPHTPIYMFWDEVNSLEKNGNGTQFTNILNMSSGRPVALVWAYFIVQLILYTFISWYMDRVIPGRIGVASKWNFCFQRSFWSKKKKVTFHVTAEKKGKVLRDYRYFEKGPKKAQIAIKVVNVTKEFHHRGRPSVKALDSISMDVYRGQITVLLGLNGAGKTTLMSIITGMSCATSGSVYINGYDNSSRMQDVREDLGFCPQYNLTFDYLTVKENIILFERLRKYDRNVRDKAELLIKDLNLEDKADSYSHQLSHGMKRSLQVACALAGNADVVVMDEPSLGMDPENKHRLWDMLLKLRGSKTFLISTTVMEEADTLGDRIAVLNNRRLCCHGSPQFLKAAFGTGFKVTLTLKRLNSLQDIIDTVENTIRGATCTQYAVKRVTFTLPAKEHESFPQLFDILEAKRREYGISVMDVGYRMEDLFLGFIHKDKDVVPIVVTYEEFKNTTPPMKGFKLYKQQMKALLKRNVEFIWAKKYQFLFMQVLVPVIGILGISLGSNRSLDKPFIDKQQTYRDAYDPQADFMFEIDVKRLIRAGANSTVVVTYPKPAPLCLSWALSIAFVISIPLSTLIWISIHEHRSRCRHVQVCAGVRSSLHWGAKFVVHMTLYMLIVPTSLLMSSLVDFDNTFNETDFLVALCVLALAFAPSHLVKCYCCSFFMNEATAMSQFFIISLALGILMPLFQYLLSALSQSEPMYYSLYYMCELVALFSPIYLFSSGICELVMVARLNAFCNLNRKFCPNLYIDEIHFSGVTCCGSKARAPYAYFSSLVIIINLCMLVVDLIFYSIILWGLQHRKIQTCLSRIVNRILCCNRYSPQSQMYHNPEVEKEKLFVSQQLGVLNGKESRIDVNRPPPEELFLGCNVHKRYLNCCKPPCNAVKGVNLCVRPGQSLAIIGPNGAGKTSTLEMLGGFHVMTRGVAFVDGHFLHRERSEYIHTIAYSYERYLSGLDWFATGQSELTFLGILHGWSKEEASHMALCALRYMGLQDYTDALVNAYSAGCLRRLKVCVMMMTSPRTLLMDEPTEAVDAATKPLILAAIHDMVEDGKRVLIASQSMDWRDMYLFCDNVALMAKGEFVAFGSPTDVKNKYATGYVAKLKLKMEPAIRYVKKKPRSANTYNDAVLAEQDINRTEQQDVMQEEDTPTTVAEDSEPKNDDDKDERDTQTDNLNNESDVQTENVEKKPRSANTYNDAVLAEQEINRTEQQDAGQEEETPTTIAKDSEPKNNDNKDERDTQTDDVNDESEVQTENVETVKLHFEDMFPTSSLIEEHISMLYYHIQDTDHKLLYSDMFKKIQSLVKRFPNIIEDYTFSETSIDEVFMRLESENPYTSK